MAVFWTGGCDSDVIDHHHYPNPELPYDFAALSAAQRKPFVQGEYGGISFFVDGTSSFGNIFCVFCILATLSWMCESGHA